MEGERHREKNRKDRSRRERSREKKKGSAHLTFKELWHVLKSSESRQWNMWIYPVTVEGWDGRLKLQYLRRRQEGKIILTFFRLY